MPSTRQILASRANGARSRGPTSDAGKEKSRMNALKHGFSAEGGIVFPDEMHEAIKTRTGELIGVLKPFDTFEVSLVEQYATEEIRAAHCRLHQMALSELKAKGAGSFWDRDRRTAAEVMAGGLREWPEVVSRQLKETPQGADLLIERWEALLGTIRKNGDWDTGQCELALDMLGVPHVLRSGQTPLDPLDPTMPKATWLSTVAETEIRTLRNNMPMLEEHDAHEQEMAMHGLEPTPDSELIRLKRYENGCMRRMQWAYTKLMGRKRMQWPNTHQGDRQPTPMKGEQSADRAPELPPDPMPAPEPDDEYASIPEEVREYARFVDVLMEPDTRDPAIAFNHFKQMDVTARARFRARQANEALAEAAAPPVVPALPEPSESVHPAPPFLGNRRARRAAAKKARQAGG